MWVDLDVRDYGLFHWRKRYYWLWTCILSRSDSLRIIKTLKIYLFLTNTHILSSQMLTDGLEWCVLLCCYQLFGLSFWRHPFTAEHPLMSKWCDATFLQIWWRNKLILILDIFLGEIILKGLRVWEYTVLTLCSPLATHCCDTTQCTGGAQSILLTPVRDSRRAALNVMLLVFTPPATPDTHTHTHTHRCISAPLLFYPPHAQNISQTAKHAGKSKHQTKSLMLFLIPPFWWILFSKMHMVK